MASHVKSQLSAYLAGGLMEVQKRQVDGHLAECEKCRQYLSKLRSKEARSKRDALKSAMPLQGTSNLFVSRINRQQAPIASASRPSRLWVFILFAVVALIGGGLKWGWFSSLAAWRHSASSKNRPVSDETGISTATVSTVTSRDLIPPSPALNEKDDTLAAVPPAAVVVSTPDATVVATPPAVPDAPRQRQWKGSFCLVKDFREIVLKDPDAWRALWHEMNGDDSKTPRVDLERLMVVGIFLGEKPVAGYTVSLLPAKEENGLIVIHYVVAEPPADQAQVALIVHPYHLMTIPKTDKKIIFVRGA